MSNEKTFWDKLATIPLSKIYLVAIILIICVLYLPPSTPATTVYTQQMFDYVETLEEDDIVLLSCGNSFSWFLSHLPSFVSVVHHMIDQDVDFVIFFHFNDGINIWEYDAYPQLRGHMDEHGYEYGKDYVVCAFLPGEETATAAFAADNWVLPRDFYGTPFEELPLMERSRTAADWKCAVAAGWVVHWPIRQWWAKYDTEILYLGHPAAVVRGPVYQQAGQIVSFLGGWEGGAQYESLVNRPGLGQKGGTILSALYFYCIGLIIIANMPLLMKKFSGGS